MRRRFRPHVVICEPKANVINHVPCHRTESIYHYSYVILLQIHKNRTILCSGFQVCSIKFEQRFAVRTYRRKLD